MTSFECGMIYAKPALASFLASFSVFTQAVPLNRVRNKSYQEALNKMELPNLSVNLFLCLSPAILLNKHHRKDYLSGNLTAFLSLCERRTAASLITGGEFELYIDLTNTLCPLELGKWNMRPTGGSSRGDA